MKTEDKIAILKDELIRFKMTKSVCDGCIPQELIDSHEEIIKDLELLDIIKKHFEIVGLSISCFISGNPNAEDFYEPAFEELKEWVKSEKEN